MKLIILLLILLSSTCALANEVKIELNPKRPVAGEVFQAYFRIFTDSDEDPAINFSPSNVEVVGKSNQGVSTRTVYANGKLTITREVTIVYDLVSSKTGTGYLRDIRIQLGNQTIKHPLITFNVLQEPEVQPDVFVMADVPKKTLFLGEGIVIRYYLYTKVPVSNLDVKKYPKLNNFLKRYIQEPERTDRVSVDGQLYMRTQIYAAKLFPEKTGVQKIDSLQLSATYPSTQLGDPFGAFGLNRDFKTKTVTSEVIKLDVVPLPQPVPSHFTGLIGQHDFQLQLGPNKLIVNEPLEVKLTVTGSGALENLEAPALIKHPGLEEFETNGDLKIADADKATKVFDYTYLAKENLNLPAKEVTLSYFDASTEKYVPVQLNLPEIVVAGGQPEASNKGPSPQEKNDNKKTMPKPDVPPTEFSAPITVDEWQWKFWLPYINLGLGVLAILLSFGWILKHKTFTGIKLKHDIPPVFKKGTFEISDFVQWMTPLIKETGKSPVVIIKESPLPEESKRYFIDLLDANDYKFYSTQKSEMVFKYQPNHFKELGRYIESVRNENSSQPA